MDAFLKSLLFHPERKHYELPEQYRLTFEDIWIETCDKVRLHSWYLPAPAEVATMLFFHGNAGNISGRIYKAQGWVQRGVSVLLVDYRGYGLSEGEIQHEKDLVLDADAAAEWLMKRPNATPEKLMIYGESLGTYAAIQLALILRSAALVLEAPFTSFVELAGVHYPEIPGVKILLKKFQFSNIQDIEKIQQPLFILHGTEDPTCPYEMSERLFEKAPEPKSFFSIPNGAHNDLPAIAGDDYWQKPFDFAQKYLKSSS